MKFLYSFIIFIVFAIVANQTMAVSPTPAAPPEMTPEQKEIDRIDKIKDLVASRVAELKLVDKRGIIGTVERSSTTQVVIEDHKKDLRTIGIDELTKFVSIKGSLGISDIKEGDKISAVGLYYKDTKTLLARFISVSSSIPLDIGGVVTAKNSRQFSITIVDPEGKQKIIDVETSTKTNLWDGNALIKSGFSRVLVGERILVMGFEDPQEDNTINASRIIHFPNFPLSQDLKKHQSIEGASPTPNF
jgi:Cu/Ag efflux protein CusF